MNFLDAKIEKTGNHLLVEGRNFRINVHQSQWTPLRKYVNKPLVFGIRPENLHAGNSNTDESISAVVEFTEQLGSEQLVTAMIGRATVIVSRFDPNAQPKPGETIPLEADAEKLHFFDPESGLSVA